MLSSFYLRGRIFVFFSVALLIAGCNLSNMQQGSTGSNAAAVAQANGGPPPPYAFTPAPLPNENPPPGNSPTPVGSPAPTQDGGGGDPTSGGGVSLTSGGGGPNPTPSNCPTPAEWDPTPQCGTRTLQAPPPDSCSFVASQDIDLGYQPTFKNGNGVQYHDFRFTLLVPVSVSQIGIKIFPGNLTLPMFVLSNGQRVPYTPGTLVPASRGLGDWLSISFAIQMDDASLLNLGKTLVLMAFTDQIPRFCTMIFQAETGTDESSAITDSTFVYPADAPSYLASMYAYLGVTATRVVDNVSMPGFSGSTGIYSNMVSYSYGWNGPTTPSSILAQHVEAFNSLNISAFASGNALTFLPNLMLTNLETIAGAPALVPNGSSLTDYGGLAWLYQYQDLNGQDAVLTQTTTNDLEYNGGGSISTSVATPDKANKAVGRP